MGTPPPTVGSLRPSPPGVAPAACMHVNVTLMKATTKLHNTEILVHLYTVSQSVKQLYICTVKNELL